MRIFITAAVLLMLSVGSVQAFVCAERAQLLKQIGETYKEVLHSLGLSSTGGVVEVFASKTGAFTVIITQPSGWSCVIAYGENFEHAPDMPLGEPT